MTIKNLFTSTLALAATLIIITSVAQAKNQQLNTQISFEKGKINPLVLMPKKTEIVIGISRADMDEFNRNPEPEKIKQFMCSIAPEYGIDWKLVYAIGYHESGNYNSSLAERNNNFFGRKASSGGYASWSTPEEGIRNQFEYLKNRYIDRGMDTPAKINPVYAEDNSWQFAIERVMNTL